MSLHDPSILSDRHCAWERGSRQTLCSCSQHSLQIFLVFLPIEGTGSIASTTWPERGFQSNCLATAYGCQKHVSQSIPGFVLLWPTLPQNFAARKLLVGLSLVMKQSTVRFNAFVRDNSFKLNFPNVLGGLVIQEECYCEYY